ncbi:MAG TPA: hypothetical protein O0X70_03985 [Methanocorpusculum sp.]|nr:hypothetical protein [Methanocorpusculum sp.]
MTQNSEYMEAFFGVELYKKFEDCLGDLENIEEDLKGISKEVARLGGELDKEDRLGTAREMRAAIYESAQQVKDTRTFLQFYFSQKEELSQLILERDAYMLLHEIYQWDFHDVRDLRGFLREFKQVCKTIGYRVEDLIDFNHMTSHPVPEDVKLYPVCAIDRHDYCLCGPDFDDIMYIDEIREELEENGGKPPKHHHRK